MLPCAARTKYNNTGLVIVEDNYYVHNYYGPLQENQLARTSCGTYTKVLELEVCNFV